MNKFLVIGAFLLSLVAGHNVEASGYNYGYGRGYSNQGYSNQGYSNYNTGYYNRGYAGSGCGTNACCEPACCEQPCNDCYCRFVRYEACPYTTKRCVEECIPCKKKCWRMVPQYYEVQRCRYVPQYYTETCCRQVRECYEVDDVKVCKRVICEPQCRYVPKYYWKRVCGDACKQYCN